MELAHPGNQILAATFNYIMLLLLHMHLYDFLYGMPVLIGDLVIGLYHFIGAPDMPFLD
jgi:hypothetical protein